MNENVSPSKKDGFVDKVKFIYHITFISTRSLLHITLQCDMSGPSWPVGHNISVLCLSQSLYNLTWVLHHGTQQLTEKVYPR